MTDGFVIFKRLTPGGTVFFKARRVEPNPNLPYLVSISIPFKNDSNSVPSNRQYRPAEKLELKIFNQLDSDSFKFVGRILKHNESVMYFYSTNNPPQEVLVKVNLIKNTTFKLDARPDPEWQFFQANFVPTRVDAHMMENSPLIVQMKKDGDHFDIPRPVDFVIYFESLLDLDHFMDEVRPLGFNMETPPEKRPLEYSDVAVEAYLCEITKVTNIERQTMANMCAELEEIAMKHNGEYDGWSSPVIRSPCN